MKEDYSIFRKYSSKQQAKEIYELLTKAEINTTLSDGFAPLDSTFSGSSSRFDYEVRMKSEDFEKAELVLQKDAEEHLEQIDKSYYLFAFTSDELYEILLKSDEWSSFDHSLARKILEERGKSIDDDLITGLKNERLKQLAKPEENQRPWIIGGYIFSFLGGLLGIIIGYYLWTAKKTLPNGEKVYSHTLNDRIHGKNILLIGSIAFPIALVLRMLTTGNF